MLRTDPAAAGTACPFILKEFRNRWFVFGRRHDAPEAKLHNLALDRIEEIAEAPKTEHYIKNPSFHPQEYFRDIIGVTRNMDDKVEHIVFRVSAQDVPYVITKPFHQSQREVSQMDDGSMVFSIDVIPNFELERDILGHGEHITILSPDSLAARIRQRLRSSIAKYEEEE